LNKVILVSFLFDERDWIPAFDKRNMASSTFRRVGTSLAQLLRDRPILSNSVLCSSLYVIGDISAQYVEQRVLVNSDEDNEDKDKEDEDQPYQYQNPYLQQSADKTSINNEELKANTTKNHLLSNSFSPSLTSFEFEWDHDRTKQIATFGGVITGPLLATWYPLLERLAQQHGLAKFGTLAVPVAKVVMDELVLEPPFLLFFFGFMTAVEEGGSWESYKLKLSREYMPTYQTSLAGWPLILFLNFRFVPVFAQPAVVNVFCVFWNGFLSYRNARSCSSSLSSSSSSSMDKDYDFDVRVMQENIQPMTRGPDGIPLMSQQQRQYEENPSSSSTEAVQKRHAKIQRSKTYLVK
jgi:hypothetical protein